MKRIRAYPRVSACICGLKIMPRTKTHQRKSSPKPRTRVPFADAERVRRHLLSENVQVLPVKDIRTMLRILNDIYPASGSPATRSRSTTSVVAASPSRWQPFLLGVGIGFVLLVLALAM